MAKKVILKGEVQITDKGLKETAKGARTLDRNLKGAARTSSSSTKNFSKMAQGMTGGLVPAYAVLAANIFAIGAAFRFLTEQANMALLIEAQESFAASTGLALQSVTVRLREASGGMLGFKEAAQAAAIGMAKGFSVKQLTDLAEGARKVSAALGRTFEDAFDRLLKGTSKAEPELLDELGITLRLEEATKRYGLAINKNYKELTIWERGQAVLIETQRQLNEQFGGIEVAINPFVRLSSTFEDIVRNASQFLLPIFTGLASIINTSGIAAVAVFGALGLSILRTALPMDTLKTKLDEWVGRHDVALTSMVDDLDAYKVKIDETKMSLDQMKASAAKDVAGKAGGLVAGGSSSKILKKVAGGGAVSALDKANLNKAMRSAEAQYVQHGKIKSGIFKGQNIEMVRDFGTSLKKMEMTNKITNKKMGMSFKRLILQMKVGFKSVKFVGSWAMRGIGKAAMSMGKMMGKAMKFAGIIGMIIMIWELIKKLWANVYDIVIGILKFTDKITNAVMGGVRKIIAGVVDFFADAIDLIFGTFYGGVGELIQWLGRKIAAMPDFGTGLAKKAGEALQAVGKGIADAPGMMAEGMREFAKETREAEGATSDLTGRFKESEMGARVKGWQDGAKAVGELAGMVDNLNNRIKAMAADAKSIVGDADDKGGKGSGFMKEGLTELQRSAARVQAITSLDVGNMLGEAMKIQKADGDITTQMDNIKAAIEPLIAHVPQFAELHSLLDKPLHKDTVTQYYNLGVLAQKSAAATAGFENSLDTLRNAAGGITSASGLYDYLELLKTSKKLAVQAHTSADEAGEIVNAYDQLNKTMGGNADAVIAKLQGIRDENEAIKKSVLDLALADTKAAQQGALLGKLAKERNKIDKLGLDLRKKRNDLEALMAINQEDLGPKELATHLERISYMKYEILIRQKQMVLEEKAISDLGKITKSLSDNFQNGMVTAFDAIIQGTKDVKTAFLEMANAILKALANIINQMIAAQIAQGLKNLLGPGVATVKVPDMSPYKQYSPYPSEIYTKKDGRYGGIIKPPVHLAAGGIASGRQAGYPATLHGTEAVVPLPQGGGIPVDLRGSGGTQNVTVNVNVDAEGNSSQNVTETTGQEALQMGKLISIAVTRELQKQKRQGGMLSPHGIA